jgi:hypothetical protein
VARSFARIPSTAGQDRPIKAAHRLAGFAPLQGRPPGSRRKTDCKLQDIAMMWRQMLTPLRVRRASKAAVRLVGPLVANSQRRLNGIPPSTWADPYVIGLVMTMITIAARLESGAVEGQMLCKVQQDAWAKITGMRATLIGEDVLLLSASQHSDFERGCRDAVDFGRHFYRSAHEVSDYHAAVEGGLDWPQTGLQETMYANAQERIWADCFDVHCKS